MMRIFRHLAVCALALALAGCAANRPIEAVQAEREQAAVLALLCADVMDLYRLQLEDPAAEPVPPKWSHFASKEDGGTWEIVGYLTAIDEIAVMGRVHMFRPKRVLYGVLARETAHPERYVLAVRGTRAVVEWLKDGETLLEPTSWGDGVLAHRGFYSIYGSMRYQPKGGTADERPAWRAVLEAVQGKPLTVAGHSLGAPLALYLTLDMTAERKDVAGRYFASPRPGNGDLASEADKRIADYVVFNNTRDLVPRSPPTAFGIGYRSLDNIDALEPYNDTLRLGDEVRCQHHAISYAALLQPALMTLEQWQARLAQSGQPRACIGAGEAVSASAPPG